MTTLSVLAGDPGDGPYEDLALTGTAAEGQARARREGADFDELAIDYVRSAGGEIVRRRHLIDVVGVDATVRGPNRNEFWVLAHGNVDVDSHSKLPGFRRTDTIRKAASSAVLLGEELDRRPILVVTSHLPTRRDHAAARWLERFRAVFFDVVAVYGDLAGFHRLQHYFTAEPAPSAPLPAPWHHPDSGRTAQQLRLIHIGGHDA